MGVIRQIKKRKIGLTVALNFATRSTQGLENLEKAPYVHMRSLRSPEQKRLTKILRPFFVRYDTDGSKKLDVREFHYLLLDLGIALRDSSAEFDVAKQRSS